MDILRGKTPEMVRKEIIMHFIVYNSIRMLMNKSAKKNGVAVRKISFKGATQALRQWEPQLNQSRLSAKEKQKIISALYDVIADKLIRDRLGRSGKGSECQLESTPFFRKSFRHGGSVSAEKRIF